MNKESLFAAAMEKSTAEREAFLIEACGDDAARRQRMEILLDADGHGRDIPERGPHDVFEQASYSSENSAIAKGPGDCIGPYKIKKRSVREASA